jgi:adenylate cyclase
VCAYDAPITPEQQEELKHLLLHGERYLRWWRAVMRATPSSPRCKMCYNPFAGIGGRIMRFAGFAPSRKNPLMCSRCCEKAPIGGVEVEIGVMSADVRGYTSAAEKMAPADVIRLLSPLYSVATDVLTHADAIIDKFIGDEVLALFIPGFAGNDYVAKMASAAQKLFERLGYASSDGPLVSLGIGMDHGLAFVGNFGAGGITDFTALGDVVNTAARLQAQAKPGQIVMSERVYALVGDRYPQASKVQLELRGKSDPVMARVVDLNPVPAPA